MTEPTPSSPWAARSEPSSPTEPTAIRDASPEPEFATGSATVTSPAAHAYPPPADFPSPDAGYSISAPTPAGLPYPAAAPSYGGYGGYGAQPGAYYPYVPAQKTNGMAVASMVTSILGALLLICYGFGALIGVVGAILGHVARRQIRDRQESGDGMALAGVIIGWIATALGALIVIAVVALFIWVANNAPVADPNYSSTFDVIRMVLAILV